MFRKIPLLLSFFCVICWSAQAQDSTHTGVITGIGEDTLNHISISGAKVTLIGFKDSSILQTTYAKEDGTFSFDKVPLDSFWVRITFPGFATMRQKAVLSRTTLEVPLSPFYMIMNTTNLDEVVVVYTPPIAFKGDTMALRADAFHTKPNATAEDLLKKLPGIEIDASGNIQAQGESVSRVLVNGKRFFDGDPKMATQNLPKDIIDQIQVYDAQSDQSQFSGFDDGNRVKTINIVIKKDKNVGYFGKQTAGVGRSDQNLYNVGGNINRFNNDQKISLLGQINNVNSQMFTAQDLGGGNGRGAGGGRGAGASGTFNGGSSGLTKTIAGGLRYADKWNKTDVDGSYFYTNMKTWNDGHSERENLYADTANNTNQNDTTHTLSRNQNHRLQFNIQTTFDSTNTLLIRPNMSFITSDNQSNQLTDIFKDNNGQRSYITRSKINNQTHNSGFNGSGNALFSHRFAKAGRTVSLGVDWSGNQNDGYGYMTNIINYVSQGTTDSINRYYKTKSNSNTIGGTVTYTEPIAKYQQLALTYNHSYTKGVSDRTTYNYNMATGLYDDKDLNLTNSFENRYNSDRVELGYHFNNKTINFSAGNGVQFGSFNSINHVKDSGDIHRNYTNLYPTASLRWNIAQSQRLMFNYSGRTSQPSAGQLQPVLDNSNELSQSIGNPDLKQSFTHSFRANYFFFDRKNNKHLFTMLSYSLTNNAIVNTNTRLNNGGQRTSYTNMNGSYTINGNFDYGFPILKPQSNFSMRTSIQISKTPSMIITPNTINTDQYDTSANYTRNYSFGERLSWTTNLASTFDINVSTEPNYTISKYSVSTGSNSNYFSQNVTFEGTWYTQSGWSVNGTFNYTYYTGLYSTSIPLLNAYIGKYLDKKKNAEIRISAYDLLNENKAVSNVRTNNYIQTSTNTVLKRYVMLTFVYNLKNFGKMGGRNNGDRGDRQFGDFQGRPGGGMGGPPQGGGGGMGGPSMM